MIKTVKRGRGRPPKSPADRKRNNVTIRMRDATRQGLEVQAAKNQRSLSEEAEYRIERSFTEEAALGGPEMRMLAMEMVATFHNRGGRLQNDGPKEWMTRVEPYTNAMIGAIDVLMRNHPDDKAEYLRAAIDQYFGTYDFKKANPGGFIER